MKPVDRLKAELERQNPAAAEVARRAGIDAGHISRAFNGKTNLSPRTLRKLDEVLGRPHNWLAGLAHDDTGADRAAIEAEIRSLEIRRDRAVTRIAQLRRQLDELRSRA